MIHPSHVSVSLKGVLHKLFTEAYCDIKYYLGIKSWRQIEYGYILTMHIIQM